MNHRTQEPPPTSAESEPPEGAGAMMSIGAVSRATGIPVATIRSWERRYGYPEPLRRESGHRRYPITTVARLRRIQHALELGNRPADVVGASDEALARLLRVEAMARPSDADGAERAIALTRATSMLDASAFDRAALSALDELGFQAAVEECLFPFLRDLGQRWKRGELGVLHEHFASERLRHILSSRWRAHPGGTETIVLAALPGEHHDLGLHVAAVQVAIGQMTPVFLGADTPIEDIAGAARQSGAQAVLAGSSSAADPAIVLPLLGALRRALASKVALAVGGGAVAPPEVERLGGFGDVEAWVERVRRLAW